MEGWVSIHRQITEHWTFKEKRIFSKFEAWIDLILLANHADNKSLIDGQLITIERGQHLTSIRKLCERWKWSNTKVVSFLEVLEIDKMISRKSDTKKTLLTIINYGKFQYQKTPETTEKRHGNDSEATQKHTNNNVNNDLNVLKDQEPTTPTNPFKLFESEGFGTLSSIIGEKLGDMIDTYGERWVIEAMKEAVVHGVRNLAYLKSILERYRNSGIDKPWEAEKPKPKQTFHNNQPKKEKLPMFKGEEEQPLSPEERERIKNNMHQFGKSDSVGA